MSSPNFDLIVYGGTPAGIACAVRAAREGLSVALVNVTQHLGGMLAAGLGLYDASFSGQRAPLVTEIFERILAEYAARYGQDSENYRLCRTYQTFEPHVAEKVLTELVAAEPAVRVWRGHHLVAATVVGRAVRTVELRNAATGGPLTLSGANFVDATYEGDLLAAAGAPYRVGRESRSEFGEPHAGRIFTRYEEGPDGPAYPYEAVHGFINLRPFDLCTGRIFPGSTGEGDRAIQAYNYRLALTRDPSNRVPIRKPDNYRRETYLGLLLDERESLGTPYPVKSKWLLDDIRNFKFRNHRTIPNGKISWNHGNFTGRNHDYPEADWSRRREILQAHRDHDLGLLWFLQNDPEVPAEVRARARELGLARDEFADNEHIPWEIYVREARRLRGRAVFTELDASLAPGLRRAPPHADSIAITDWMMDSHECTTERQPGSAYEGAVLLSELTRPGHVPFRCLLPPNLDNLLVPVCLSATHVGWGTIRLEPTWIHIAESAAWACVLASRRRIAPATVDVSELQRLLVGRGVMLAFFNEFDMGTREPWVHAVQFFGPRGFFASYDARPDDVLDEHTAWLWAEACVALRHGEVDSLRWAQRLANLPAGGVPMSEQAFRALIQRDGAQGRAGAGPLTRGAACRLMYEALFPEGAGQSPVAEVAHLS
jgi:hypothetical protein